MTNRDLRDAVNAQPFQPFKFRMVGGRTFEVRHPEFVRVMPGVRTFWFFDRENRSHRILDLLHTEEIEFPMPDDPPDVPEPPSEPAAANG